MMRPRGGKKSGDAGKLNEALKELLDVSPMHASQCLPSRSRPHTSVWM